MVSKLKFLGVAAGVARKFASLTAATLTAAVCFAGCDDVKSLASSISVEEPLVHMEFNNRGNPYLVIQSQDNETSINSVKLNRGNCGVELYRTTEESLVAYARANKDRVLFDKSDAKINFVYNGQLGQFDDFKPYLFFDESDGFSVYGNKSLYTNDLPIYNGLDEASKAAFVSVYPVKLPYGEKFSPKINCDASKIIEVELDVNGATLTYNFNQGGL